VIEGVPLDPFAALAETVQVGVAPGQLEALGGDLDPRAALGAGLERVKAEGPGVAEDVEHATSFGVGLQGAAIEPLVEVQPVFCPAAAAPEAQFVEDDLDLLRYLPGQERGARLEPLARARREVAALVDAAGWTASCSAATMSPRSRSMRVSRSARRGRGRSDPPSAPGACPPR